MELAEEQFSDLQQAVDFVHLTFRRWETEEDHFDDPTLLHRTRLALHEWLANLAQHADFEGRRPEVSVRITPNDDHFHCAVVDNSRGFNLEAYTEERPDLFTAFPERGMGLQIISVCTDKVSYIKQSCGHYCFDFTVSSE